MVVVSETNETHTPAEAGTGVAARKRRYPLLHPQQPYRWAIRAVLWDGQPHSFGEILDKAAPHIEAGVASRRYIQDLKIFKDQGGTLTKEQEAKLNLPKAVRSGRERMARDYLRWIMRTTSITLTPGPRTRATGLMADLYQWQDAPGLRGEPIPPQPPQYHLGDDEGDGGGDDPGDSEEPITLANLFPPKPEAELDLLRDSIRRFGVLSPVVVDEQGDTITGHNRQRIATELGIPCPLIVKRGLTDEEKMILNVEENFSSRNLSHGERTALFVKLRRLGWTQEKIATHCGVSPATVNRGLREFSDENSQALPGTRVNALGAVRPTAQKRRAPGKPRQWTEQDLQEVARLKAEGKGRNEISQTLDLSSGAITTIYAILKERATPPAPAAPPAPPPPAPEPEPPVKEDLTEPLPVEVPEGGFTQQEMEHILKGPDAPIVLTGTQLARLGAQSVEPVEVTQRPALLVARMLREVALLLEELADLFDGDDMSLARLASLRDTLRVFKEQVLGTDE